jgi:RNA polymerase sigma-70 factor, ECF subfamily
MPATLPKYAEGAAPDHLVELYTAHAHTARELACRLLFDQAEAEDVVHDVFLNLWGRPTVFDPARGSGRAFVMTVVRNRSRDHLRRRVPREDVDDLAERLCDPYATDVVDALASAARSDQLWRLVASLPAAQG